MLWWWGSRGACGSQGGALPCIAHPVALPLVRWPRWGPSARIHAGLPGAPTASLLSCLVRNCLPPTCLLCLPRLLQGPEIRTGFLENEQPVKLEQGQELTITTDYSTKGHKNLIAMSYKKLAQVPFRGGGGGGR